MSIIGPSFAALQNDPFDNQRTQSAEMIENNMDPIISKSTLFTDVTDVPM